MHYYVYLCNLESDDRPCESFVVVINFMPVLSDLGLGNAWKSLLVLIIKKIEIVNTLTLILTFICM